MKSPTVTRMNTNMKQTHQKSIHQEHKITTNINIKIFKKYKTKPMLSK